MVIALIVNREGFPFSYETFDGNRADVTTMETILRMVERKYGKARRIWVMDRGIVSEENLAAIRKRGGQYLVGTPRRQMKRFEAELLQDNWTQVRPDVEVKQVAIPQGGETYILCRTAGRQEKEQAIRKRFSTRMEAALHALEKSIASGRLKDRYKMERRLGRIQARHPQVNDLFEVTLRDTPAGVRLVSEMKADRKAWRDLREGAYMLRTNLTADSAEELWSKYMQLTEAEASFRALKSELSIRPLFHQKEPRVKAHVLVAFLGYALWVTLKHRLKRRPAIVPQPSASGVYNAQPLSPMKVLALLSTLRAPTSLCPRRMDARSVSAGLEGKTVQVGTLDIFPHNGLSALRELLEATNSPPGYAAARISNSTYIECVDFRVVEKGAETGLIAQRDSMVADWIENDDDIHQSRSFDCLGFGPNLAPLSVFPFEPKVCIDLLTGAKAYFVLLNVTGVARQFEHRGWQIVTTPQQVFENSGNFDEDFMTVRKEGFTATVPPAAFMRMQMELL